MACKPCEQRWRIILSQQSKFEIMKDKTKKGEDEFQESESPVITNDDLPVGMLDVNKLIAERRAKMESGKIVRK